MRKITVLFDVEILENGLRENASRSGIFFVAYNVFGQLLRDERVRLCLFCRRENEKAVVDYLQKGFNCQLQDSVFFEGDNLSFVDYFLSPCFTPPAYVKHFPQITCMTILHDTIPLIFPHYFGAASNNSWFMQLVRNINKDDYYFAVSKYTKEDFIKYVPQIDPEKIGVVRLAADDRFYPQKDEQQQLAIREKYHIPQDKKYIFSLCTLEPRKNLIRSVSAFISFIEKNNVDDLVYVLGGGAWQVFVGRLEAEVPGYRKYADRIIQAGYVADEDLASILSHAEWFVYTSQYEGFGLPPLEAMQCGCPVVVSNNSSLPEVVGDAGIMIDYDSLEQHIEAYETYYYNAEFKKQKTLAGLKRAAGFTWKNCVDVILDKIFELEERKQEKPLVTVVTVIRNLVENNRTESIRQCVESVHSQTYPNVEHVVIDGASTDGTLDLLQEYVQKGWITLYSEPDKGIYDAMNKGIEKAKGDYVAFLNSDDFYHEEKGLELSVAYLLKNKADYSFADARVFDKGVTSYWKADLSKLLIASHYGHETMLVKTEVLRKLGGFDLSYTVSADSDLMIRLYAQKYKSVYVPFPFLTYRTGGFSALYAEQSRLDHSSSFYKHIGSYIGLAPCDCFFLWNLYFLEELNRDEQMALVGKVPEEFASAFLIDRVMNYWMEHKVSARKEKYYLYGWLPFWKRRQHRNKTYDYLFGFIRMMKKVHLKHKGDKYYLLSFIPIWWEKKEWY